MQIIQQYLRSNDQNESPEDNGTTLAPHLTVETNWSEITTLAAPVGFPSTTNTPLPEAGTTVTEQPETETPPSVLTVNVTRHCDDCYEGEVCVALVDEDVPSCRVGPDPLDPTGCDGLCIVNKQKCHRLDVDAFR